MEHSHIVVNRLAALAGKATRLRFRMHPLRKLITVGAPTPAAAPSSLERCMLMLVRSSIAPRARRAIFTLGATLAAAWAVPAEATVWTPTNEAELDAAVSVAEPGDEIVVSPGIYYIWRPLWMHTPGVTLRGATGNRDDIVLSGTGMNTPGVNEGISVGASDVVIRDLTVRDFYWNGIHTRAENNADRIVISNVRTWDIGERHIKGSRDPFDLYTMSDDILIENVYMLQTTERDHRGSPNYIGGIDMMAVNRLVVRQIVAEGIRGHFNGGNAAIFLWNGVTDVLVEKNRIYDCAKGIALGNPSRPGPFPGTGGGGEPGEHHARGGIIRNNMVRRGVWTDANNIGLELASTRDVGVYHNTFFSDLASYFRLVSISHEGEIDATENVVLGYNILRGNVFDLAGSGWSAVGNIQDGTGDTVTPEWFADPSVADFHLTPSAWPAMDQAAALAEVLDDFDDEARVEPADVGADEVPGGEGGIVTSAVDTNHSRFWRSPGVIAGNDQTNSRLTDSVARSWTIVLGLDATRHMGVRIVLDTPRQWQTAAGGVYKRSPSSSRPARSSLARGAR